MKGVFYYKGESGVGGGLTIFQAPVCKKRLSAFMFATAVAANPIMLLQESVHTAKEAALPVLSCA